MAPQLVTLAEKRPVLSSYTPTIFLPAGAAALAPPTAAAATQQHSARSSGAGARAIVPACCCAVTVDPRNDDRGRLLELEWTGVCLVLSDIGGICQKIKRGDIEVGFMKEEGTGGVR